MSPATTKIRVRVVPLASGTFHQKVATPSSTSSSLETKDGEGASSVTTVVTVERTHPLYRSDRGVLRHKYDSHASLQQQHQKEASSETSSISSITSVVLIPQESFKLGRIKEEVPATTAPANNGEEVQMRNSLKTKEAAPPPPPSTPPRSKTAASASTSPSSTPNTAQRHHRQSSNRKRFQLRRLHSSSSSINNSSNKTSIMRRISPKRSASGTISDDDDNRSMSSIKRLLTGVSFSDRSGVRSSGSMNSISVQQQQQQQQQCDPMNWGFPGYLTSEEADVYEKLHNEIQHRSSQFKSSIFCFGMEEPEPYALCRWLRARKFKYDDVITMIEEATKLRTEPSKYNFYPTAKDALGVDESIYKSQYPQVYYSRAKNGSVLFISKPGVLNMMGMECVTTPQQINKFQWHSMIHAFGGRLRHLTSVDSTFCRFASTCVLDLEHLSSDAVNRKVLDLIQRQSVVDGICFPESLSRVLVVNAPGFFSLTWKIIRRWLDPRTVGKVEIISNRAKWEKRLLELVDPDQLPSDYGGEGESTVDRIARMDNAGDEGGIDRRLTETMSVRSHASTVFELNDGEEMDVDVFTRALDETIFSVEMLGGVNSNVSNGGTGSGSRGGRRESKSVSDKVTLKFSGGEEGCLQKRIASKLHGPAKYKIIANSNRGMMASFEHYLLVGNVRKI